MYSEENLQKNILTLQITEVNLKLFKKNIIIIATFLQK